MTARRHMAVWDAAKAAAEDDMTVAIISDCPDAIGLLGTLSECASTIRLAGETVYIGMSHRAFAEQALRDAEAAAHRVLTAIKEYEARQ